MMPPAPSPPRMMQAAMSMVSVRDNCMRCRSKLCCQGLKCCPVYTRGALQGAELHASTVEVLHENCVSAFVAEDALLVASRFM